MSSYKKHHYVPKFLLRQFSGDGKRINVFQIHTGRKFTNVGLKDQCYENFYYGKDPQLEKAFSKMEDAASRIIKALSALDLAKVAESDLYLLRQFIYLQAQRTKGAAEQIQRFTSAAMKPLMKKIADSEGIDKKLLDKVHFRLTEPQNMSLYAAASSMPAVMDLAIKVLVSPDNVYFILSDNPVVIYNQFAEHHPIFSKLAGTMGYALKGVQIFLPISPRVCICLYDQDTYQYGSLKTPAGKMSKHDVLNLNSLQATYADTCLYLHSDAEPSKDQLSRAVDTALKSKRERRPITEEGPIRKRPDGKYSQLIFTHGEDVRIGAKFSFAQVKDKGSYAGARFLPPRSIELVQVIREHGEAVKAKEAQLSVRPGKKDEM